MTTLEEIKPIRIIREFAKGRIRVNVVMLRAGHFRLLKAAAKQLGSLLEEIDDEGIDALIYRDKLTREIVELVK